MRTPDVLSTMRHGSFVVWLPERIDEDECEDLAALLDLMMRGIRRRAKQEAVSDNEPP